METQAPLLSRPQPAPWYRQRSLQLIAATLVFLSPLLALPIARSQAPVSQPLALRGQPILRLQALSSGATTWLYAQTPGNLWRSVDDGLTWERVDNGLLAAGLGASQLLDWTVTAADPHMLYAVVRTRGDVRLLRSSDGGGTWRAGGRWTGERMASAPSRATYQAMVAYCWPWAPKIPTYSTPRPGRGFGAAKIKGLAGSRLAIYPRWSKLAAWRQPKPPALSLPAAGLWSSPAVTAASVGRRPSCLARRVWCVRCCWTHWWTKPCLPWTSAAKSSAPTTPAEAGR